jgi:1-acyl-sn-glycerol-3-phosphate acyltransferase
MGIKYEVEGLEKLPNGPYLVLSNHQSFWENFFMQLIIPEHSWVIKKELFEIPVFGWGLRMVEPIAVDRSATASIVQILEEGQKKLQSGLSIVIFPEGTRVKPDRSVAFKPSAAKLALKAEVPVVLMAHNAGVLWPKGFWFQKSGTINVKIIESMMPSEIAHHDARSLTEYIQERINAEKRTLAQEAVSVERNSVKSAV